MPKRNIWDYWKEENEKTYTNGWCGHKDRYVTNEYIACRTCGASVKWNGKNYQQELPKVKFPLNSGTNNAST